MALTMRADLHIHTVASDGRWTPEQVVAEVQAHGIGLFAVADHDTIASVPVAEASALKAGLAFLRGDFAGAQRWAEVALSAGNRLGADSTEGSHGVQMFMIHRETGALARFAGFLDGTESFGGRWVPGLLALYTELGGELSRIRREGFHPAVHAALREGRVLVPFDVRIQERADRVEAAVVERLAQPPNELPISLLRHRGPKYLATAVRPWRV